MSAPVRVSAAGAGMASADGSVAGSRGFWRAIIGHPNMVYNWNYRAFFTPLTPPSLKNCSNPHQSQTFTKVIATCRLLGCYSDCSARQMVWRETPKVRATADWDCPLRRSSLAAAVCSGFKALGRPGYRPSSAARRLPTAMRRLIDSSSAWAARPSPSGLSHPSSAPPRQGGR